MNLSGDVVLVCPMCIDVDADADADADDDAPIGDADADADADADDDVNYTHLLSFLRTAPFDKIDGFIRHLATAVFKYIDSTGSFPYISTHGEGIAYLHFRISPKPYYYHEYVLNE